MVRLRPGLAWPGCRSLRRATRVEASRNGWAPVIGGVATEPLRAEVDAILQELTGRTLLVTARLQTTKHADGRTYTVLDFRTA